MFDAGAVVFRPKHPLLYRAGAFGVLAAEFFPGLFDQFGGFALAFLKFGEETFTGQLAVHGLGTRILDGDADIRGEMAEGDAGGNLVHVLPARPGRTAENLLQFGLIQRGYFHK